MAARKYNTYKFRYSSDLGNDTIRVQREYLDTNNQPLTPITNLFLARVITDNSKWEPKKNSQLRHAVSYVRDSNGAYVELISFIPYSDVVNKSAHLREIDAVPEVICIKYIGEVIDYAK